VLHSPSIVGASGTEVRRLGETPIRIDVVINSNHISQADVFIWTLNSKSRRFRTSKNRSLSYPVRTALSSMPRFFAPRECQAQLNFAEKVEDFSLPTTSKMVTAYIQYLLLTVLVVPHLVFAPK
jgi:hypothetical protein